MNLKFSRFDLRFPQGCLPFPRCSRPCHETYHPRRVIDRILCRYCIRSDGGSIIACPFLDCCKIPVIFSIFLCLLPTPAHAVPVQGRPWLIRFRGVQQFRCPPSGSRRGISCNRRFHRNLCRSATQRISIRRHRDGPPASNPHRCVGGSAQSSWNLSAE